MTLDAPGIRHQRRSLRRCLGETRTAPTPRPQRGQPHVDGPLGGPSQYHGLWPWLIIQYVTEPGDRFGQIKLFWALASWCARTGGRRPFSEGATVPVCSWLRTNWRAPARLLLGRTEFIPFFATTR